MSMSYRSAGRGITGRRFERGIPRRCIAGPVAVLLVITFCASLFGLTSCRSRSAGGPSLVEAADTISISPGIDVTVSIIPGRDEIEKRFKIFLPDSGIVPLEVTVRNRTGRPVRIHTSHGLDAPESFYGFALEAGNEEYVPLSPIDVLAVLMGVGEPPRYRRPGIFDAVVGIAIPPAILYYGHREMSVGRHYRSIFKQSIYKAAAGGATRPILLEPGGEAEGFLFFYLPPGVNPYHIGEGGGEGVDSVRTAGLRLTLRPSDIQAFDTLPGTEGWGDAAAAYIADSEPGEPSGTGERDGIVFALPAGGKWRGGGLLTGRTREVLQQGGSAIREISEGVSSNARIAGTAALGRHAVCAVNFKATSRVYIVAISGSPALLKKIDLDRKIRRIFLVEDGLLVATNDDRCRYLSLGGMKLRRNVKIGRHIRDLFLDGDRLFVLGREEVSIFSATMPDPLRLIERRPLGEANRRFVGIKADVLYLIHWSGKTGGDTLAVYDRGSLVETARTILPASVGFSDVNRDDLLFQLDGGTILRVRFDVGSHRFEVECAGYLPFEAGFIERAEGGYTVLGKDGTLARGDIVPPVAREFVTVVPVDVKLPEVTSSRSRAKR